MYIFVIFIFIFWRVRERENSRRGGVEREPQIGSMPRAEQEAGLDLRTLRSDPAEINSWILNQLSDPGASLIVGF